MLKIRFFRTLIGSPPPMRGKDQCITVFRDVLGITPAYAGKRNFLSQHQCFQQDHPRLCGEKSALTAETIAGAGSPPPMRGKGPPVADVWKRSGITPAYAGKRSPSLFTSSPLTDHPRLCGEKTALIARYPENAGSPPPMRGKGYSCDRQTEQSRITPAYAGKSQPRQAVPH